MSRRISDLKTYDLEVSIPPVADLNGLEDKLYSHESCILDYLKGIIDASLPEAQSMNQNEPFEAWVEICNQTESDSDMSPWVEVSDGENEKSFVRSIASKSVQFLSIDTALDLMSRSHRCAQALWMEAQSYQTLQQKQASLLDVLKAWSTFSFLEKWLDLESQNRSSFATDSHVTRSFYKKLTASLPFWICCWCGLRFSAIELKALTKQIYENPLFQQYALLQASLKYVISCCPPEVRSEISLIAVATLSALRICNICHLLWRKKDQNHLIRVSFVRNCQSDNVLSFDEMKVKQAILLATTIPFGRFRFHLGRSFCTKPIVLRDLNFESREKKRRIFGNSIKSNNTYFKIMFSTSSFLPHYQGKIATDVMLTSHGMLLKHNPVYRTAFMESTSEGEIPLSLSIPRASSDLLDAHNGARFISLTGRDGLRKFLGRDLDAEVGAFPHLFPYGVDERTPPFMFWKDMKDSTMKLTEYVKRRVLGFETKFVQNHQYMFLLLSEMLKDRMFRRVNYLYKGDESNEERESLAALLKNLDPKEIPAHKAIKRCFSNIPPLEQYFKSKLTILDSACSQLGPPTLFLTFSINEANFASACPLLQINQEFFARKLNNSQLTDANMGLMTDYHIRYLYAIIEFVKDDLKAKGLHVSHFCHRFEFQMRGTPHIHALFWLKNAPPPLDFVTEDCSAQTMQQWIDLGDKLIFTARDLLSEKLRAVQTHHHLKGKCDQKSALVCSKEFPRLPMKKSLILLPTTNFCQAQYHKARRTVEEWRRKILSFEIKEEDTDDSEYVRWLDFIGMSEEQYIKTLSLSIVKPSHYPKRRIPDMMINCFNREWLMINQSNMDVALVTTSHSAIRYITKYISKVERADKNINVNEDTTFNSLLFQTLERYQTRPMSLQECIFTLLDFQPFEASWNSQWCIIPKNGEKFVSRSLLKKVEDYPFKSLGSYWDQYVSRPEERHQQSFCEFLQDYKAINGQKAVVASHWTRLLNDLNEDDGFLHAVFLPTRSLNPKICFNKASEVIKKDLIEAIHRILPFNPALFSINKYIDQLELDSGAEEKESHVDEFSEEEDVLNLRGINQCHISDCSEQKSHIHPSLVKDDGDLILNSDQFAIALQLFAVVSQKSAHHKKIYWIVVGAGGTGKSILLQSLRRICETFPLPTEEITEMNELEEMEGLKYQ